MSLTLLTQKLLSVSGQIVTVRGLNKKKILEIFEIVCSVRLSDFNEI